MNIIFLSRFDPRNIHLWSGTAYHIYHKLLEKHRVAIVGPELIGQLSIFSSGNFPSDFFLYSDRYVKSLGRLCNR